MRNFGDLQRLFFLCHVPVVKSYPLPRRGHSGVPDARRAKKRRRRAHA